MFSSILICGVREEDIRSEGQEVGTRGQRYNNLDIPMVLQYAIASNV